MPNNLFDRLTGSSINLDGRTESLSGPDPDEHLLLLSINPAQVMQDGSGTITVQAIQNGLPLINQEIFFDSTDEEVGSVPTSIFTDTAGKGVFQIIGGTLGSADISAFMVVNGVTYDSNIVEFTVVELDQPIDYNATGYGAVTMVIESPFANALNPKVQRLSHPEQVMKFGDDTGLRRASFYETAEIVFLPKELLR